MHPFEKPHINVFFYRTPRWVWIERSKGKSLTKIFVEHAKETAEEKTELGYILKEYFKKTGKICLG
jgi:hypothetical protein